MSPLSSLGEKIGFAMATRISRISGFVYDDVQGEARLAPVYDLVTTSAYLPKDSMALTLNGTTKWASTKELQRLGETRMGGTPARVRQILERIEAAIADTSKPQRNCTPTLKRTRNSWRSAIACSSNGRKVSRFRLGRS